MPAAVALAVAVAGAIALVVTRPAPRAVAASAPGTPAPRPGNARVQGFFSMSGVVTDAVDVDGEHRGERVTRVWAFASSCPSGACPTVAVARQRRDRVTDNLILHRRAPGFYVGRSAFDAPVLCGGHRYARGERVPFRLTVRVTAAIVSPGGVLASRVHATYTNVARIGLTRCVSAPAHDAVRYRGVLYVPPTGENRSDASSASTPSS